MIDIQWKGKVGYGDIVSPLCYAHNVSFQLNEPVNLTFRWDNDSSYKYDKRDPETLWERTNTLNWMCQKQGTQVTVQHAFNSPLDINHTNYDWKIVGRDRFHNYWKPVLFNKPISNVVVVNTTERNTTSLKRYGKGWKDLAAGQWPDIIKQLSENYTVVPVDYRTPMRELLAVLLSAKGFIGYHGTAAWVARFLHVPSVLFADGGSLTRDAFFYAKVIGALADIQPAIHTIDSHFDESRRRIRSTLVEYESYKPSERFIGHLQHEQL